jgi:hypothetical protein
MKYVAIINVLGYLPTEDEPPVFDTAAEAWDYLATIRREHEDDAAAAVYLRDGRTTCCSRNAVYCDCARQYSDTVDKLGAMGAAGTKNGTVYGDTPWYEGDHDLGLAYSVQVAECSHENQRVGEHDFTFWCDDCGEWLGR